MRLKNALLGYFHTAPDFADLAFCASKYARPGPDLSQLGTSYLSLGSTDSARMLTYQSLFEGDEIDPEVLIDRGNSANKGLAFGSAKFKEQVEEIYKRRVRAEKPGPKEG